MRWQLLARLATAFRPTALTLLLFGLLVVLGATWSCRVSGQLDPDGTIRSETDIGHGLFRVTTTRVEGRISSRSIERREFEALLVLCALFGLARALAAALAGATRGLLSPTRWLTLSIAVTLALAALGAAVWSRSYWGYAFHRPPLSASIDGLAAVDAVSSIRCERAADRYRCGPRPDRSLAELVSYCRKYAYECLGGRIATALTDAGLIEKRTAELAAEELRTIERQLAEPFVLAPVEVGYTGNDRLSGVAARGRTAAGRPVLALGLAGGPVANDHHPYYELLLALDGERPGRLRSRTFFWDVAGIEGFEWPAAFVVSSVVGLSFACPTALVAAALAGHVKRRRSRRSGATRNLPAPL